MTGVRAAARSFIKAAFASLKEDHVLPRPLPPLRAGWEGLLRRPSHALSEYQHLETLLNEAYSEWFAEPLTRQNPEFASGYLFSLLEACVARCGLSGEPFEVDSPPVERCIDEFLEVLDAHDYKMVCCRMVSHLTTTDGTEVEWVARCHPTSATGCLRIRWPS